MALADGLYGLGIGRAVVPRIAPPRGANNVQPFRPRGMEAAPIARPQLPPMPPNPLPMVVDRLRSAGAALLRLVRDFFAQLWGERNINRKKAPLEQGLLWEGTSNSAIELQITKVIQGGKSTHCWSTGLSFEGASGSYQSTEYGYGKSVSVKRGRAVATSSCTGTSTAEYVNLGLEIVSDPEPEYDDPGGTSEVSVGSYWNGNGVGTWQSISPQVVYFTVDSVKIGSDEAFSDPSLWQPISFDWPLEPLSFVPKPIEPVEAEPEPARQPVRRPVVPPMPLPSRPPGTPAAPPSRTPTRTPSQPRPLAPPAPQPNQPAPTQPSPTPQAPPADAEVLRIQEIIRRVAPPITTTATPVSPAGPQTQTVTNSGTVVDPAPAPTPQTPTDARQYGTTTITSGAPRIDPAAVAEELGRVEQKLGRLVSAMDKTPDWLDSLLTSLLQQLIPALLDALKVDVPPDTWEFSAPCDRNEDGEPITHTVELPGEDFPEATITRLNEIAQVLQVLKDWRQPLCRGQNVLSNVTVTALEIQPEA